MKVSGSGSDFLRRGSKRQRDRIGDAVPVRSFVAETRASAAREAIELCAAFVVRGAPLAFNQSLTFEPVQRGIEGALLNLQGTTRNLLNAQEHTVAVQCAERHGFEHEKIELSGQQPHRVVHSSPE